MLGYGGRGTGYLPVEGYMTPRNSMQNATVEDYSEVGVIYVVDAYQPMEEALDNSIDVGNGSDGSSSDPSSFSDESGSSSGSSDESDARQSRPECNASGKTAVNGKGQICRSTIDVYGFELSSNNFEIRRLIDGQSLAVFMTPSATGSAIEMELNDRKSAQSDEKGAGSLSVTVAANGMFHFASNLFHEVARRAFSTSECCVLADPSDSSRLIAPPIGSAGTQDRLQDAHRSERSIRRRSPSLSSMGIE
ncbi:hypothetical protein ON010_g12853 [Phytophthora cinnamomi]|nr:hypothetical protein ON010_g12853 [Phytophthora cinnamomi]